ncbi:ATP-binding protein [Streptomyces echinoruber]|uniref:histidine kinase n=1 Tax=Streptomyces echinoruber TaxID=68898 RepID=A0A918VK41_9ACTN|nr:ATP-binding protein [Streptomyces echinoruber]GHA07927.1 ATPase [Streptomyces echinoruber]
MAHLRAPAAPRADRREGGRHGRPVSRTAPTPRETPMRSLWPPLLRLAVLPPTAVALGATAAVLYTVRSTGARPAPTLWAVLAGAVSVTLAGILVAAVAARRTAASVRDRVDALRHDCARGEADLRALVEALRRGETPPQRAPRPRPPDHADDADDVDDIDLLAADLARVHDAAVTAVSRAAQLSSQAGSEQKLEVFVNLARRLQSLVHREISLLDELENELEDPDLLKGLFHVDHLATRIRRHAENLAVLGGAVSRRQWSRPVAMTEVLRSAVAEVEQYARVRLVPPVEGTLRGHAVADVIHLLAELVENATVFSAPHTQVLLRASLVTSGLAVEVEDRGLGLPVAEQDRMNALLADPDQVSVAGLLADGRIGLYVVSQLARRHGITVRLQTNIYGGVQAVLVVPRELLGTAPDASDDMAPPRAQQPPEAASAPPPPHPHDGVPQPSVPLPSVPQSPVPLPSVSQPSVPLPSPARPARPVSGAPAADAVRARPVPAEGAPPPLPRRGAHARRPTPAEAAPGIRPEDRPAVAAHTDVPPVPRADVVRGTMDKPGLPRRRAREHLVPQLRERPQPRPEADRTAGHDPGLMAAFRRGVGLAEAQQHLETAEAERGGVPPVPHPDAGVRPDGGARPDAGVRSGDGTWSDAGARSGAGTRSGTGYADLPRPEPARPAGLFAPVVPVPAPAVRLAPAPEAPCADPPARATGTPPAPASPEPYPPRDDAPAPGPGLPAPHDGSAPAG